MLHSGQQIQTFVLHGEVWDIEMFLIALKHGGSLQRGNALLC